MNSELLFNVPPDKMELAKLLLFSIKEKILLWKYIDSSKKTLEFKNDLQSEMSEVLNILIKNKAIELSYSDNTSRYILAKPFIQSLQEIDGGFIDDFRNVWDRKKIGQPGKKSDKPTVKKLLDYWMSEHPEITKERILLAANAYIKNCVKEDRLIRDCANFIGELNDQGIFNSLLSAWVEEVEEGGAISRERFTV